MKLAAFLLGTALLLVPLGEGGQASAKSLIRLKTSPTNHSDFRAVINGGPTTPIGPSGITVSSTGNAPVVVVRLVVRSANGALTDEHFWRLNRSRFDKRGADQPPLELSFDFEAITSCPDPIVTDILNDYRDLPREVRGDPASTDDDRSADQMGAGPMLLHLAIRASVLANACLRDPLQRNRDKARQVGKVALGAYDILLRNHAYLTENQQTPWPFGSRNWGGPR